MDDDFEVYPFRRQLVEETLLDERLPQPAPRQAPAARAVVRPVTPHRRSNPLKWAAPLAVAVFIAALAAAATISHPSEVQQAVASQIAPAEAEAAPKPQRHRVVKPKHIFVPDVTGLPAKRALKLLKQGKFVPHVRRVVGTVGRVLEQKPRAATEVRKAGVVLVVVGKAKPKPKPAPPAITPTVIVTSVVGLQRDVAVGALRAEGLGVRVYGVRSLEPAGTVVAQSPASGSRAKAGTYARINVSVG